MVLLRNGINSPLAVWLLALAATAVGARRAEAVVVRFEFSLNNASYGVVDVRLYDAAMPRTVANFLDYVDDNDWDNSFIHRRAGLGDSGVEVVQGGGFRLPAGGIFQATQVPSETAILDEPGGGVAGPSNLPGTIAMAKSGPDTATNQWFFNTVDNSVLDDPNDPNTGGFSAFGRVVGDGMTLLQQIVQLGRINAGGPFANVPVYDVDRVIDQQNIFPADAVIVTAVRRLDVPAGDYNFDGRVSGADLAVLKSSFGSTTQAEADGSGDGVVDGTDFLLWQRTLGQNFGPPASAVVPEPAGLAMAGLAALGFGALAYRRRVSSCATGVFASAKW